MLCPVAIAVCLGDEDAGRGKLQGKASAICCRLAGQSFPGKTVAGLVQGSTCCFSLCDPDLASGRCTRSPFPIRQMKTTVLS